MASPYVSVSVSGYNANPPADDGSAVLTNQIKWSTIKTKLDDPLNTAIASINANVVTAIGKTLSGASVLAEGVNYAVTSGDQGKLVKATAAVTITFPDATSVGSPFVFAILNNTTASNVTLAGASAQTINGSTSLTMPAGDGYIAFTDGSNWFVVGRKTGTLPTNYGAGCRAANGADTINDITITAGKWRDSTDTADLTVPAFPTGKQLDANWATGDAAGCRNSAAGITDGTYHYYAVGKADGSNAEIYAVAGVAGTDPESSASYAAVITALHLESGGSLYVYARRLFSVVRLSNTIIQFIQSGNYFRWVDPPAVVSNATPGTSANTVALVLPLGLKLRAMLDVISPAGGIVYFSGLDNTDSAASSSGTPLGSIGDGSNTSINQVSVWTNASAQIRYRSDTNTTIRMTPVEWLDFRGRD